MKEFISPVIVDIADLAEGVYAASGSTSTDEPIIPVPNPGTDGWDWSINWANHNSGSHSEMELRGHNYGNTGGNHIKFVINFIGQGIIDTVSNVSKATSYSWTQNSITLVYDGVYNPGESITIGFQITFDGAPNCEKGGHSYWPSGQNCNTSAAGQFAISYIEYN